MDDTIDSNFTVNVKNPVWPITLKKQKLNFGPFYDWLWLLRSSGIIKTEEISSFENDVVYYYII